MELNWVLISSLKALWRFAVSAATNPPGVMLTPLNRMVSGPLSSWPCPAVATAALPDDAPLPAALLAAALPDARFATEEFKADVVVFTSADVAAASLAFTFASFAFEFAEAAASRASSI